MRVQAERETPVSVAVPVNSDAGNRRSQSIDVLRCVAVLLVLGRHLPYYGLWSRVGWIGVDLFFVLSGFLISGLLFKELGSGGGISCSRFIVRRGFKIYPTFYVFVGLMAFGLHWANIKSLTPKSLVETLLFVGNYFPKQGPGAFDHLWSLAIEEHFYVLLPLLLIGLTSSKKENPFRCLPVIFAALVGGCLLLRIFTRYTLPWATHLRIDELFAGVTLGYLYGFRPRAFRRIAGWYAPFVAAAFCAPAFIFTAESRAMNTWGLTCLLTGFSFLVAWAADRPQSRLLGLPARIGYFSYSIYVWQMFVVGGYLAGPHTFGRFWVCMVIAVLLGITMSSLIEMPALALRERIFPAIRAARPSRV